LSFSYTGNCFLVFGSVIWKINVPQKPLQTLIICMVGNQLTPQNQNKYLFCIEGSI